MFRYRSCPDNLAHTAPRSRALIAALAALGIAALVLYAYRELPGRPFAADDYQWLLNVRGLSFRQVVRTAFDAGSQVHFYRPLVWLLFWCQSRLFGLEPRGYHVVTLALHLLNAALLGALARRLGARPAGALLAAGIVALHPAPFEAITWISAQSELLAAALLLVTLHLWLPRHGDRGQGTGDRGQGRDYNVLSPHHPLTPSPHHLVTTRLLATVTLGLALLAKESAVIGLPLLVLLDSASRGLPGRTRSLARIASYALPGLLAIAYAALQVEVERRNYLLQGGGYGIGAQLVLNPLRSLALLVAPLPGSEHADAAWLVPLGGAVALGLLALFVRGPGGARRLVLALLLTLLPTAPFATPPDSRYLYLPVMALALLVALGIDKSRKPKAEGRLSAGALRWIFVLCSLFFVLALAWAAVGELAARENRFAAASGPGGSLWRTASAVCAAGAPQRVIVVDPPLAAQHAEAIIHLACGPDVRPLIVSRDQLGGALAPGSIVVGFPGGSAVVEQKS